MGRVFSLLTTPLHEFWRLMATTSVQFSVVRGHRGQVVVRGQVQCNIVVVCGHHCSWSSTV